jgi:very-short-patch-repair endonuclease
MPYRVPTRHVAFARRLRREATQAETILWGALRGSQLDGKKFRRRAPIGRYVADFLCVAHRLIVELDGPPHDSEARRQHDALRDSWLCDHGYRILRVPNETVIGGGNIVLDQIRAAIGQGRPAPDPPSSGPR